MMIRFTQAFENDRYAQSRAALLHAAAVFGPLFTKNGSGTVVILDISGMGRVNDRHGASIGDRLLCAVEDSLQAVIGTSGVVARLAGDQFLIAVPETALVQDLSALVCKAVVRARVRGRRGRWVRVQTRIGIAGWNEEYPPQMALAAAAKDLSKAPRLQCGRAHIPGELHPI